MTDSGTQILLPFQITPETWIISDTHFGHKNIVKYCNRPLNHNEKMYRNWQSLVRPTDTVLHLGDVSVWYGDEKNYWLGYAGSLPGKKYLILGNHDKFKPVEFEREGFTIIPEFIQEVKKQRVLFSHYPDDTRTGQWDINVHGHIHNNLLEHRLAQTNRRYKNVSIEVMDYKPVQACDILVF